MTDTLVAARAAAILAADDATSPDGFIETAVAAFDVQRAFVERAAGMPFAEAARLVMIARHAPMAFGLLRDTAKVQAGEWVVVMGAAGGLGFLAVQIAKMLGAPGDDGVFRYEPPQEEVPTSRPEDDDESIARLSAMIHSPVTEAPISGLCRRHAGVSPAPTYPLLDAVAFTASSTQQHIRRVAPRVGQLECFRELLAHSPP